MPGFGLGVAMRSIHVSKPGKLVPLGTLMAGLLALGSCATLNEDQCNVTDWQQLGFSDGSNGRAQTHVARHQEACTKFGVAVDVAAWQTGWNQGIASYCTFENGESIGSSGRFASPAVCPGTSRAPFEAAYIASRDLRQAQDKKRSNEATRDRLTNELAATPDEAQRQTILTQIETARLEIRSAELDIREAEFKLSEARARFPAGTTPGVLPSDPLVPTR